MNEELKNNSWRKFCNVDPKESFKNSDFEVPKEMKFVEKIPENENEADDAGVQENLSYSLSFSDLDVDYVPSSFEISNEDNCNSQDSDILNFDTTSEAKDLEIVEKEKNMKQKKKYKKKAPERDNCYFCETEVLNFSRHIARCHSAEIEVQRLLAKPVKSKERKNLITSLRKKGNYLRNSEVCSKPMKKPPGGDTSEYLPSLYCLGFYSRKQLWRHKKRCTENPHLENNISSTSALYFKNHKTDPDLRDKVFPRMRPDKVSIVAQQDALICAFGSRYLRVHRKKHFINVTSRKMRELSRLLIEAKKLDKSINTMMDMLQPKYYDTVVTATKLCAKYDKSTECFLSPTFAMNIATSLKQCCDLAIVFALKRKHIYATVSAANAESAMKTFAQLIEANWRYDISTVASNNLHIKRWNKITIIPLAKDLKLMKNYLTTEADKAKQKLSSENENKSAYKVLTETVYCRVLLLNRKRPGELQRLLIDLYNQSSKRQNYEEFSDAISPTEKFLMNRFKRIVIRGKRNRGVPVLFSTEVQKDISIMNEIRHKYVREENRFLFALPDSDSHIVGYKVLAKYAKACGAERHDALTSTRLRKHLATLSQIFSMTDSDLEQLSTFMGHTPGTHKNSYRLPDDVYQSSKIVKILLLMEQGNVFETHNSLKILLQLLVSQY
ncbi:uncharacterized protein LOC123672385 [Harmonia axyridis]|uniref:uncharacterized protein LOC123672385 n=1 Tax=Harmonia axyridis TaxID=115357 RepID=UPI001E27984E|nr:uncharacterized protein LOC123672385 [Harmonia axyridis]